MQKKIAIIGAGIVGATIAYSLAKRHVEVHVFDKQIESNDPTRYSLAWLNAFRKTPLDYYLFYNFGLYRWPWFHEEIGGECDLVWGGALSLPLTASAEQTLKQHLNPLFAWGYPVHRLGQKEMSQLEPEFQFNHIAWAAHCVDEGFVDAEKCTNRLLTLAQHYGATIHRPQVVTRLIRKENHIDALVIDEQQFKFDMILLASGTTICDLAASVGVAVPQRNIPVFLVETAPCKQRFDHIAVLHLFSDRLRDIRQNLNGCFWIAEVGAPGQIGNNPQMHAEKIVQEFAQYYPPIKNSSFTYRIVTVPKPLNGKSIFSFAPGIDNLYIALSHSAVVIAPLIGEWITHELLNNRRIHWFEQFRLM